MFISRSMLTHSTVPSPGSLKHMYYFIWLLGVRQKHWKFSSTQSFLAATILLDRCDERIHVHGLADGVFLPPWPWVWFPSSVWCWGRGSTYKWEGAWFSWRYLPISRFLWAICARVSLSCELKAVVKSKVFPCVLVSGNGDSKKSCMPHAISLSTGSFETPFGTKISLPFRSSDSLLAVFFPKYTLASYS